MIEQDTVKLLRECDAGIKMGVYSIEEVLGDVNNGNFKQMLEKAKSDHQQLQDEIQILLDKYLHRGNGSCQTDDGYPCVMGLGNTANQWQHH